MVCIGFSSVIRGIRAQYTVANVTKVQVIFLSWFKAFAPNTENSHPITRMKTVFYCKKQYRFGAYILFAHLLSNFLTIAVAITVLIANTYWVESKESKS
ncbi:hypothetical protein BGP78_03405 [Pseudoalteromonas sp. MSK9-3]|nr:hypothetical protein BGP78_03405 [Pseudoalteromonas sp. MSK9-3]